MKRAVWVLFLGAALGFWASTLSARSGDPPHPAADSRDAATQEPVSLVEISGMAIVETSAFSAPFECDSTATPDEMLASAREMFLADNYSLAELLYKCLLRREPTNLSAILELSVVYEKAGMLQYAKGLLTRAEILKPDDAEIAARNAEISRKLTAELRSEVDSLFASGAYDTALPKLSMLLESAPDDAELYYKKARCYLALRDAEGALYEIDKALRLEDDQRFVDLQAEARALSDTRDVETLERDARGLLATGRKADAERAIPILKEIVSRDPGHKWAKEQFAALTTVAGTAADTGAAGGRSAGSRGGVGKFSARAAALAVSVARVVGSGARGLAVAFGVYGPFLLGLVVLLAVFRSPLSSVIIRGFNPRQELSGRLGPIDINAVLSFIHAQGGSGVLHVRSGPVRGKVYFVDGEICHCRSGKTEGRDAVRRLLSQTREGSFVLAKLPRAYKKTIDVPFSLVLMDLGEKSFLAAPSASADRSAALQKKSKMKSLLEKKA